MNRLIATSLLDTDQGPGHTRAKSGTDAGVHVVLFIGITVLKST